MNNQPIQEFENAVRVFVSSPNAKTLLGVTRCAIPLLDAEAQDETWRSVDGRDSLAVPFASIRTTCDRDLDAEETLRLVGCLAYALRATLAGEDLGSPCISRTGTEGATLTVVICAYDSTTSARTDPDPSQAFSLARQYIVDGTPVRTTDRTGRRGTRLVEGIGPCNITFAVR